MLENDFPPSLAIPPQTEVKGQVTVPGSKSYSNRALLVAALAKGRTTLHNFLDSEDTKVLVDFFKAWGLKIERQQDQLTLEGWAGKLPPFNSTIYLENAGTAVRFLTSILTLGQGTYQLDGNASMRKRPILDLITALRSAGAEVKELEAPGFLPLAIKAGGFRGGKIEVAGENSSQYVSSLLLAAPYAEQDTAIIVAGSLVSTTYIDMTLAIMRHFGVKVEKRAADHFFIAAGQSYQAEDYWIEPDASSASYFFALPALLGGEILLRNIPPNSLQGDFQLLLLLERMGCKVVWQPDGVLVSNHQPLKALGRVDMRTISDVAPTLAAVALFADGVTEICRVENMRIKECDRIRAVFLEFQKLGAKIEERPDGWIIEGSGWDGSKYPLKGAVLETYQDHRMAMVFSLVGLKVPGVEILNPACVQKTFPNFFSLLFSLFPR